MTRYTFHKIALTSWYAVLEFRFCKRHFEKWMSMDFQWTQLKMASHKENIFTNNGTSAGETYVDMNMQSNELHRLIKHQMLTETFAMSTFRECGLTRIISAIQSMIHLALRHNTRIDMQEWRYSDVHVSHLLPRGWRLHLEIFSVWVWFAQDLQSQCGHMTTWVNTGPEWQWNGFLKLLEKRKHHVFPFVSGEVWYFHQSVRRRLRTSTFHNEANKVGLLQYKYQIWVI